ncbi:MAG: hypothetical protein AUK44_00930 [Porphyromonadaceae bacterium CG2_30_38_12]|nr:MAG: hypothetical protein AUK44_00930 [Porphyromonadaceae bacterium CG2_30_38_12]
MLIFDSNNRKDSLSKEWIYTNGLGSYASSTISGANTRRYHALLVASHNPPVQREVLVSKIDEAVITAYKTIPVSSNFYPSTVFPNGFEYIQSFKRSPFPEINFVGDDFEISKTIFMVYQSNTTIVAYKNLKHCPVRLALSPYFVHRDYHSLYHANDNPCEFSNQRDNIFALNFPNQASSLYFKCSKGQFNERFNWHLNNEYPEELYRGQDFLEDSFSMGTLDVELQASETVFLMFSTDASMLSANVETLKAEEEKRLDALIAFDTNDVFLKDLMIAADQFVVDRHSTQSESIVAGYHWFTDWGRDTMIAMKGLAVDLNKKSLCESLFTTFLQNLNQGMIPNRFADNKDEMPEYNTIDATLWLFVRLYEYYQKFGAMDFIQENFTSLEKIIQYHIVGTHYNIHVSSEGFLCGGMDKTQLTWMDARIGDYVVTPRHGAPVEIQALWYNALKIYIFFSSKIYPQGTELNVLSEKIATKLKRNFVKYFYNTAGYLHDVLDNYLRADATIRPNQIYALSLPFPLINKRMGREIMRQVDQNLFTPYGLRSLSPADADFEEFYQGNLWQRDKAYHQGTVWVFLLADYFKAKLYTSEKKVEIKNSMAICLDTLQKHFYNENCIQGISEIFDGLQPQFGRGTVQQAWSVSAVIELKLLMLEME